MYIKSLEIKKYKALKDLNITLSVPEENKNVTNVIAGVNGSGKSSLLEFILIYLGGQSQTIINGPTQQVNFNIDFKMGTLELDTFGQLNEKSFLNYYNLLSRGEFGEFKVVNFETTTMGKGIARVLDPSSNNLLNVKIINLNSDLILGVAEEYIKKHIVNKLIASHISDPSKRITSVVDEFNEFFKDVDLLSKLANIDTNQRPLFKTITNEFIPIEHLSSGEKQLYAKVILLKMLEPENSIILIDEPDLTLHPKWQAEIMRLYSKIGKNNQFIITTHSPFIIAQTSYKNLIFLENKNGKIEANRLLEAPLDSDINTILKTTMSANYISKQQEFLHNKYRKLVKDGKEDSADAKETKKEILKLESFNSSFFQDLFFDMELEK